MINNKIDVLKYFDGLRLHFGYPSLDYEQKVPADWSTPQVCQLPHFRPPSQPNLPGPSWFSGIFSLEYTALLCMKGSCFYWSLSLWHPKWCSRITSAKKSEVTGHKHWNWCRCIQRKDSAGVILTASWFNDINIGYRFDISTVCHSCCNNVMYFSKENLDISGSAWNKANLRDLKAATGL